MSVRNISNKVLSNLKPDVKPYFVRDNILKGFGVRVNPMGKRYAKVEVSRRRELMERKVVRTPKQFWEKSR